MRPVLWSLGEVERGVDEQYGAGRVPQGAQGRIVPVEQRQALRHLEDVGFELRRREDNREQQEREPHEQEPTAHGSLVSVARRSTEAWLLIRPSRRFGSSWSTTPVLRSWWNSNGCSGGTPASSDPRDT